jgi:hypothetical protein
MGTRHLALSISVPWVLGVERSAHDVAADPAASRLIGGDNAATVEAAASCPFPHGGRVEL